MTDTQQLVVTGLRTSYGSAEVLKDVDLTAGSDEIVALLGNNGAGKTTLLRALTGTLRMHRGGIRSGRIEWAGRTVTGAASARIARSGVAHVPEGRQVFGRMTVEENLRVGATARRGRRNLAATRDRVLELFPPLQDKLGRRSAMLSGGEQQMVAIGRGLMGEPRLLLLDEPFLGLAPKITMEIAASLARINEQGTGVVLVEQNSAVALSLAHRAYVLDVGRVALSGRVGVDVTAELVRAHYLGGAAAQLGVAGR